MILKPTVSYLFDTTVFIDSYRGRTGGRQIIRQSRELEIRASYSFITFLEMRIHQLEDWDQSDPFRLLRNFAMLGLNPEILGLADHYENVLQAANRARRRRLPEPGKMDCIIAATAYLNQMRVVTRNRRHFGQFRDVPNYAIEVEQYDP